ncbi:NADH:flavin oxidoreductase/NADH oxidase family protein [Kiloniella majae]|uniref:NADH:flavin oxidoreductase/NADH oxidase family protein n=1 Tax=Kiloniella majae TaxID=1938558 RepID=UPI000A2796B8|nr:NADH:flavin oxidoreductase/NADH oxidase family protein [Kiloniella majae]
MIANSLKLPSGAVMPNRIVKSAMSEALGDDFNNPSDGLINIFHRWGKGGAGLLITGNTPIDRWHLEHAGNVVLDHHTDINRMKKLTSAAKSGGAYILAQLAHAGRQTPDTINAHPISMSNIRLDLPGYGEPRAAIDTDLEAVITQFTESAWLAKEAGFDGVEIHAAHGYLLSSSLSPRINTRDDNWGGSLENRARLLLSVIRSVRTRVGQQFIVAVKLNSSDFQKGGFSHEDSIEVAKMLQGEGIDFLEISGGNFETPVSYQHTSRQESTIAREAYFLEYARDIKKSLNIPIMVTGGFRSRVVMDNALSSGATDLIGMGRPFIIDPEFPEKLLKGLIDMAPAMERDFPPAEELPRGAVLNWFCHQLSLHGTVGDSNLALPIVDGHERYLVDMQNLTKRVLKARRK